MIVIPLAYHGFHRFGEASEAIRKADAEALAWRQARRARGTRKTPGEAVSSGESAMDPVGNVGKSAWNAGFTWIYGENHGTNGGFHGKIMELNVELGNCLYMRVLTWENHF